MNANELTALKEEIARRAAAYEVERQERKETEEQTRIHERTVIAKQKRKFWRGFLIDAVILGLGIGVAFLTGIITLRLQIPLPRFLDYGWWIWIPVVVAFWIVYLLTRITRVPVVISCCICFGGFGIFAGASYRQKLTAELGRWETTNTEDVMRLVRRGADINVIGERGYTVLLRVARWGDTNLVRFLIDHGANVQAKTPDGKTGLMEAFTYSPDAQLLAVLVNAGVDVRTKDNSGKTVLHYASQSENDCARRSPEITSDRLPRAIRYLIKAGADPNASDNTGQTPLMLAAGMCNPTIVGTLLEAKASPNAVDGEGNTALLIASRKLDYFSATMVQDAVGLLVEAGADVDHVDSAGNSALHLIARSGKPPTLKLLLMSRRQLERRNSQGLTPLMVAATTCNYSSAEFLLSSGANIVASTGSGEMAIDLAAREGCVELTQQLAQKAGLPATVAFQKLATLTKRQGGGVRH